MHSKILKIKYLTLTIMLMISFTGAFAGNLFMPVLLKCEHLTTPLGIDEQRPRLSWQLDDRRQGAWQSAYQVFLSPDSGMLAAPKKLIWNSSRVNSSAVMVSYGGPVLKPFTRYYWKVRTWDKGGYAADSKVTYFETGMMGMGNWTGSWISDRGSISAAQAPYFRKTFITAKKIRSARAYIAVAGLYELYINGKKIGDHRLDPMYTRFDRRNLYVTYDITHELQNGDNAVGVLLGNGWYNHQSLAVWNFDRAPWRQRPTFCLDLKITTKMGPHKQLSRMNPGKPIAARSCLIVSTQANITTAVKRYRDGIR